MNNMNSATADTGASAELIQRLYRLIEERDTQISELRKENISLKNYHIETERMNTQIAADYQTLNRKYENLLQENKQLKAILDKDLFAYLGNQLCWYCPLPLLIYISYHGL